MKTETAIRLVYSSYNRQYQAHIDIPTYSILIGKKSHPAKNVPTLLKFQPERGIDEKTMLPFVKHYKTMDLGTAKSLADLAAHNPSIHVDPDIYKIFEEQASYTVGSYETDAVFDLPENERGYKLYDYQRAGALYLSRTWDKADNEAIQRMPVIGDDMGLGKTAQVLAAILKKPSIKKILIICPKSLKINWENEIKTWFHTIDDNFNKQDGRFVEPNNYRDSGWAIKRNLICHLKTSMKKIPTNASIYIVNYDTAKSPKMLKKLGKIYWDLIALDEAHMVKNPSSIRGKAMYKLSGRYWVSITGTLVDKEPFDAFNILKLMYPSRFGDRLKYRKEFPNEPDGWERLNSALRSTIFLGRKKHQIGGLPPYIRTPYYIEATPEVELIIAQQNKNAKAQELTKALQEMKEAEKRMMERVAELEDHPHKQLEIAKLRDEFDELCRGIEVKVSIPFEEMSYQRKILGVAKAPHVIDLLKEQIGEMKKIVVPYHHHLVGDMFEDAFGDECVRVDGQTKKRQDLVDLFNEKDNGIKFFFGSIKATNFGLNLHHNCSHMVFAERAWKISDNRQMEDRIHRDGQKFTCTAHFPLYQGSLDDRMFQLVSFKAKVQHEVLK